MLIAVYMKLSILLHIPIKLSLQHVDVYLVAIERLFSNVTAPCVRLVTKPWITVAVHLTVE